jgi:ABC-type branched-chain amino acid transport systems, ATPase component
VNDILLFGLLGAASGGLYAVLALGLVVVYRSSKVINFSHAAIAVTAAYVFNDVRNAGMPTPVAMLVAAAVGIALGVAVDLLVMRPLRRSSALTRAIASIGVVLTLQAVLTLRYGSNPSIAPAFLPTTAVPLGPLSIGADRLIIIGISIALTVVLALVYRRTTFGLATSALSESRRSLSALGWSPTLIGVVNWGVSGLLAATAGVLLAPITGLTPALALIFLLPALAAALLGNLASFPLTLLGGILVGIVQAETGRFFPVQGLQESIPFFGIILVLALRGRGLPERGFAADVLPKPGTGRIPWAIMGVAAAIVAVLTQFVLPEVWVDAFTTCIIVAIILLSLVVVTGYGGQLSLASFALAGIGAVVTAILMSRFDWPFLAAAAVAVLASGAVGFVVGLPAVRTRGTSLAIVTLGLAVTIQSMVLDNEAVSGGFQGLPVSAPSIFGLTINPLFQPRQYSLLALVVLLLAAIVTLNIRRSPFGRQLIAVRTNERAAASIGINVPGAKLGAFVISGMIAAVGGILLAFRNPIVVVSNPGGLFDPFNSLTAIAQATIGGIGYAGGAVAGTLVQSGGVASKLLDGIGLGGYMAIIAGLLLLITVITAPDGLAANFQKQFAPLLRRLRRRPLPSSSRLLRPYTVEPVESAKLEVRGLTVAFGANRVLTDVGFTVESGRVLGVIGPNGAGKTTLIDAITGYTRPESGQVLLDGDDLSRLTPAARSARGVIRSFQSLELFEDLSVVENLLAASEPRAWHRPVRAGVAPGRPQLSDVALASIAEFGLEERLDAAPSDLSYGDRRLLGIARSLATRPRVLLLDEPAAGLGSTEREELRTLVRALAEKWNIAVLLIEHDVDLVMAVSDEVLALDFGRVITRGAPQDVRRHPGVIAAYLGVEHEEEAAR